MAVSGVTSLVKHSGINMAFIFCTVLFFRFASSSLATELCNRHKHLIVKPTSVYTHCGVKIKENKTIAAPTIVFPWAVNETTFNLTTIIMMAPLGQNSVHWLKKDVPTELLVDGATAEESDEYPYIGPEPPEYSGFYTYQFYLLSQPLNGTVRIKPFIERDRKKFKMAEFRRENGMELLGYFEYQTEYHYNNSGKLSSTVILGIISMCLAVLLSA